MNDGRIFDQNLMDLLAVLSFYIGLLNYDENLSQSDKDDMMHQLDEKTNVMLKTIEDDLNKQNDMLREILKRLESRDEH